MVSLALQFPSDCLLCKFSLAEYNKLKLHPWVIVYTVYFFDLIEQEFIFNWNIYKAPEFLIIVCLLCSYSPVASSSSTRRSTSKTPSPTIVQPVNLTDWSVGKTAQLCQFRGIDAHKLNMTISRHTQHLKKKKKKNNNSVYLHINNYL